jgi:hypothetical protein
MEKRFRVLSQNHILRGVTKGIYGGRKMDEMRENPLYPNICDTISLLGVWGGSHTDIGLLVIIGRVGWVSHKLLVTVIIGRVGWVSHKLLGSWLLLGVWGGSHTNYWSRLLLGVWGGSRTNF